MRQISCSEVVTRLAMVNARIRTVNADFFSTSLLNKNNHVSHGFILSFEAFLLYCLDA
jgi:hypothetical protein